jgi:AcrR family transcriptional regulator
MRTALLHAAIELMQESGPAGLTLRNITSRAGCSTTVVYTYFGGKHGLVEAIFVEGFESFDEATKPLLAADDLLGAGRAYRRWALANPVHYMVMFGHAVPDFEPTESARERARQSFGFLAEAIGRAHPGNDVLTRAYHHFATVHGYVMLELAGMATPFGRNVAEQLYESALLSLGSD